MIARPSLAVADDKVPFTLTTTLGRERVYVEEALSSGHLTGDGKFTASCERWLERTLGAKRAILTPSCTSALEMAALLLDLKPGDEVIMPSFTCVSTANAFVLRGAVPVFVDIRPDTLNINETLIAGAITPRTRAIAVVHYAGQPCAMETILEIADEHRLDVVEDAAQALLSDYRDRPLGTFGRFGCLSFNGAQNTTCGHGGALLVNRSDDIRRADIVRQRGTDKRSWVDVGSSYFISEVSSAYLLAQLEQARTVTAKRQAICRTYRQGLENLEQAGHIRLPVGEPFGSGNAHIFYLLTRDAQTRAALLGHLRTCGVEAAPHYTPLHGTPGGMRFGRVAGDLSITDAVSETSVRLPVFPAMDRAQMDRVLHGVRSFFNRER